MSFTPQPQQAMRGLARLPWAFEPNVGQTDQQVKFLARADGATVFLTQNEAVIAWQALRTEHSRAVEKSQDALRLQFAGASSNPAISGEDELPGKTNYLIGRDPRKWRTNVPHFSAVSYREIYPGVSARFYGGPLGLEYDLRASPGSDVGSVTLRANDSSHLRLDARGNLLVRVADREVVMRKPEIYQPEGARKIPVEGGYRLLGDNSFGFRVGPYRADLPLIIDPSISVTYTTFLGGNGAEKGNSVAVDSSGAIYVGGTTTDNTTFPEPSPTPTNLGLLTGTSRLFVAKIDATKTGAASLVYLTFIGGSGNDQGGKIAVDNSPLPTNPANLAILGWTTSTDFPTLNATTAPPTGPISLTVSKLNGTGNGFIYSEYYGGNGSEATQGTGAIVTNATGGGIATDSSGDIFVTSDTTSTDLPAPAVPNGFQPLLEAGTTPSGTNNDGFFAKFDPSGNLLYSTYFGIAAMVGSTSVAVDMNGNAYVAGFTSSPSNTFPPLGAATFQSAYGGGPDDGIILQINPNLAGPTSLVYASFLGGAGADQALAIGVDTANPANAYVTGTTQSSDFVSKTGLTNGFQTALGSGATSNAFFAVVSQSSIFVPALSYASYLGGTGADSGQGVAVVSTSDVLVAGSTTSTNFPVFCPSQGFSGSQDIFIASFNPTASGTASLGLSTLLGGSSTAEANAIATDASGDAIVFGDTTSSDYPVGRGPSTNFGFQPTCTSCSSSLSDALLTSSSVSTTPSGCVAFSLQGGPPANFGSVALGTTAVPVAVQLTNVGNSSLTISGFTIVGANSSDFSLPSNTNSCPLNQAIPSSPATGSSCSFEVDFTPSVLGPETATLQVTDDGAGSPQSLALDGTGTSAEVSLLPQPPIAFGNQAQGTQSNPMTVTLTNTGNNSLTINSVTLAGVNPNDFIFTGTNTCVTGAIVSPQGTCDVTVAFAPNEPNPPLPLSAQVNISFTDNTTNATGTVPISLTGTETSPPAPAVSISPASLTLNFNNENVGVTSGAQTVTITNSGSAALIISNIAISGTDSGDFNQTNNCPIGGTTGLAVSGNCTINVTFTPAAAGPLSASLAITDNATPTTQTVSLSGTGTAPGVSLSPSSLSFGNENVGSSTSPQPVTLTNTGSGPLTINSISLPCPGTGDFCQTNNCPVPLNSNTSCTISVIFHPTATGTRTASITISDDSSPSTQSVALSGMGTQPVVALSPSSGLAFPPTVVGTASGTRALTVTNTGTGPLVISMISFTGADAGDFSETDTCTGSGVTTAAGGNCVINVNFTPLAAGARSANIVLTDNASNSPQQDSVGGQATDFQLVASGGVTTATISAGQTAIFPLQVDPKNSGFTGTVTFGCTNPPPKGTCTVSPPSVQVTGSTPVSFSVSVGTASNAFLLPRTPRAWPRTPKLPIFMWIMIGLLVAFCLHRSRGQRKRLATRYVLAFAVLLLSSCGGGGGGTTGGNGTPPGAYTVTATGLAGSGAARTLNLTVAVQ